MSTAVHPDRAAFCASIVAEPDDDTVRLAFADWLDENGDPDRAEFIRAQVDLARLNHSHPSSDRAAEEQPDREDLKCECQILRVRSGALLAKHKPTWVRAPVCETCNGHGDGYGGMLNLERPRDASKFGCPACFGTGDAGGLLRTFRYPSDVQFTDGDDPGILQTARDHATFRRGFPDEITVPRLEDVCERRIVQNEDDKGGFETWRPTPWFRAVLRHHPIAAVVCLDRNPMDNCSWNRNDTGNGNEHQTWYLPRPIWNALDGEPTLHTGVAVTDGHNIKSYRSRSLAVSALARAVVAWAGSGAAG